MTTPPDPAPAPAAPPAPASDGGLAARVQSLESKIDRLLEGDRTPAAKEDPAESIRQEIRRQLEEKLPPAPAAPPAPVPPPAETKPASVPRRVEKIIWGSGD